MVDEALESLTERQSTWRPAELVRELATHVPTDRHGRPGPARRVSAAPRRPHRRDPLCRPVPTGSRRGGGAAGWAADHRTGHHPAAHHPSHPRPRSRPAGVGRSSDGVSADGLPPRPVAVPEGLSGGQVEVCAAVAGSATVGVDRGSRRDREDHRPHPRRHRTASVRVAPCSGWPPPPPQPRSSLRRPGWRRTRWTSSSTNTPDPTGHPTARYGLAVGATVIVDEAGTLSTPNLAELARLADHHQWRIVMVGDPRQFSAVGRGGMFSHLTNTYGAIELDQVHRFTHQWEGEASLRLRTGDPIGAGRVRPQGTSPRRHRHRHGA